MGHSSLLDHYLNLIFKYTLQQTAFMFLQKPQIHFSSNVTIFLQRHFLTFMIFIFRRDFTKTFNKNILDADAHYFPPPDLKKVKKG